MSDEYKELDWYKEALEKTKNICPHINIEEKSEEWMKCNDCGGYFQQMSSDALLKRSLMLWEKVNSFVQDEDIYDGETIYQCDHVALSSLDFIDELCQIVGYKKYEED